MKKLYIITAFPNSFTPLKESIVKRAQEKKLVELDIVDLKKFGEGRWNKIDDRPFGGGAGMLLEVGPIYRALKSINFYPTRPQNSKILLTSARGADWEQGRAKHFAQKVDNLVIICGHYEGVDNRVVEHLIDEEVSIGNYILSGGELASMVIVDSIIRLLPGALGNEESAEFETQFKPDGTKHTEHPQYTRPEIFKTDEGEEWNVPKILLSGNHAEIDKWKAQQSGQK